MISQIQNKLIQTLRAELPYLKKEYKVKSVSMFGSYVRNEETPVSDLDLLVTFTEAPGFIKFIQLENYLSDKLGIRVDLVMEDALKKILVRVSKKKRLAYESCGFLP